MDYVRTHDIRFSYRLSGTSDQWISLERQLYCFQTIWLPERTSWKSEPPTLEDCGVILPHFSSISNLLYG